MPFLLLIGHCLVCARWMELRQPFAAVRDAEPAF